MAGFASGFAQGFGSTYQPGRKAEQQRLGEALNLQKQQFQYQQTHDTAEMDFQKQQAAALEEHQKYGEQIQAKQIALQQRAGDLDVYKSMSTILDANVPQPMKEFMFKNMAKGLGIDPKSQEFKDFSGMILKSDADTQAAFNDTLAAAFPEMQPGQVTALTKAALSGKIPPNELFGLFKPQPTQLKPIMDPSDPEHKKQIYAPESAAVGQEVPPSGQQITIQNKAEGAMATGLAGLDIEDAKKIREDAASAQATLPSIQNFRTALQSGKFVTGTGSGIRETLGRAAEFVGVDPQKLGIGLGSPATAEVLDSASHQLAITLADKMSRMTNMSLTFVVDSVPNLARTPQGNSVILDLLQTQSERAIRLNKLQEQYINRYGTLRPSADDFPGVPTFFEARDRLISDYADQDKDLESRMAKESQKGVGVDWKSIPGMGTVQGMLGGGKTYKYRTKPNDKGVIMGSDDGKNWEVVK